MIRVQLQKISTIRSALASLRLLLRNFITSLKSKHWKPEFIVQKALMQMRKQTLEIPLNSSKHDSELFWEEEYSRYW
jgi:hypothetical protein